MLGELIDTLDIWTTGWDVWNRAKHGKDATTVAVTDERKYGCLARLFTLPFIGPVRTNSMVIREIEAAGFTIWKAERHPNYFLVNVLSSEFEALERWGKYEAELAFHAYGENEEN